MSADMLRNLLQDFGNEIGIADLQLDEDARCNLMFDDIGVSFELSQSQDSFYAYAYLGAAPDTDREDLYAALLDANYLFKGTGGATLGVEAATRRIVLIREERLESMQVARFESIVEEIVNTAEEWQEQLARPADMTKKVSGRPEGARPEVGDHALHTFKV